MNLRRHRRPIPGRVPHQPGQDGQVGLLILGVCVFTLTFVIGIIDVTALQLARVRMYDVADAAALDAADSLAEEAAYRTGVGPNIPLTEEAVRDQAGRYLAATGRPDHVSAWALAPGTGTRDGQVATVVLIGTVQVPIGSGLLGSVFGPVQVTVAATAQARVTDIGPRP